MNDFSRWTLGCGMWGGVRVRLHASFFVMAVIALYIGGVIRFPADASLYGLMAVGILLSSVVLHELGHVWAARRLDGDIDLIVLGPLGGMHPPQVPHEPQREFAVALAGPTANFAVMVASGTGLLMAGGNLGDMLLQPLYPGGLLTGPTWFVTLKMAFWLNWLLFIVNLIPAMPLDGGRALHAVLWPVMGHRGSMRILSRCGLVIAVCLAVIAWALLNSQTPRDREALHWTPLLVPSWAPLLLMAIYLFFSSRMDVQRLEEEEQDDESFEYDFSQGYTSFDRATTSPPQRQPGILRRWLKQREEQKLRRLRQLEDEEERRADEVLARVKEVGMQMLSSEERALLERVSARYRSRLQR